MPLTPTQTVCKQQSFEFQGLQRRKIITDFSAGFLSTDGGVLLLRETARPMGIFQKLAACFNDSRNQEFIEHPLETLLQQRILGLALGYEDLNDHDQLRHDPLLAAACGQADLTGARRKNTLDQGVPLAGKSTLNRLELSATGCASRYKKLQADPRKIQDLILQQGVAAIPRKSQVIILDFDATDSLIHGHQEGRFFHGYYDAYCYLPLYCFCGDIPLWAQLRSSDRDGADGTLPALQAITQAIRARFGAHVTILVRGDSGFCRDELLTWIESQANMRYLIGLARNPRLQQLLEPTFTQVATAMDPELMLAAASVGSTARPQVEGTGRAFAELRYRTRKTWSRERRVIGKAEITNGKDNPRFLVTNLTGQEEWIPAHPEYGSGQSLYEQVYCARGDMENRIKEQQLDLFADRLSTQGLSSNQLRLWFSTIAYLLLRTFREKALVGTKFAQATVGTIRLRLLKIAAQVSVSVRRVHVQMSEAFSLKALYAQVHERLTTDTGGKG